MKTCRFFGVMIATFVVLTVGIAGQAMAEGWTWMHGSAAAIEHLDRTNWWRVNKQALDLDLKHGQTTLVHIGIQTPIVPGATPSGSKADKIQLLVYTGSDLKITKVYLYHMGWEAQAIVGDIHQTSPYYFWAQIPISNSYSYIYDFGISLEIAAGTNSSLEHRFCLATAGVHWTSTGYSHSDVGNASHGIEAERALDLPTPLPPKYGLRRQ